MLGIIAAGCLRLFAFALRLIGSVGFYVGRFVVNLYDLIIFPTIWLEGVLMGSRVKKREDSEEALYENGTIAEGALDDFDDTIEYKEHRE